MSNKYQLSAGEAFDDLNSMEVGEGFIVLATSAGNRRIFRSPAEANYYRINNPSVFAGTPDSSGSFNENEQNPTTV